MALHPVLTFTNPMGTITHYLIAEDLQKKNVTGEHTGGSTGFACQPISKSRLPLEVAYQVMQRYRMPVLPVAEEGRIIGPLVERS